MSLSEDHPRVSAFGTPGFDAALAGMSLAGTGAGTATVLLPVGPEVVNAVGTLHGGAIATLVDVAGTIAIMGADEQQRPGVTTDLNVSYFSAGRPGTTVTARARVLKSGKTLAFVSVDVEGEGGKLLAQGRMTKFMGR